MIFVLASAAPFINYLLQLKLRLYGSKSVVKYPRCSLRRQSTYADAEVSLLLFKLEDSPNTMHALPKAENSRFWFDSILKPPPYNKCFMCDCLASMIFYP